jgi:hypothetical protein
LRLWRGGARVSSVYFQERSHTRNSVSNTAVHAAVYVARTEFCTARALPYASDFTLMQQFASRKFPGGASAFVLRYDSARRKVLTGTVFALFGTSWQRLYQRLAY